MPKRKEQLLEELLRERVEPEDMAATSDLRRKEEWSEEDDLVLVAQAIKRSAPRSEPSTGRQMQARTDLHSALAQARRSAAPQPAGRVAVRGWLFQRRAFVQAAAALLVIVAVGGIFLGTSETGADLSQPIISFFSSDSDIKVEGVITAIEETTIYVAEDGVSIAVLVTADTEITGTEKDTIDFETLSPGQNVEIKGTRDGDGAVIALRIRVGGLATDGP